MVMSLAVCACSTTNLPNAFQLIHSRWLYRHAPSFVGVSGPLSREQGQTIVRKLEARSGNLNLLQEHLAFEQAISGEPLVVGNKVTLLKNGPATYAAMFSAIRTATDSINLETYIFADDVVGREFARALIEKQRQGVQVNVIYDSFGSLQTPASFFDQMRQAGIKVLQFDPINPLEVRLRWRVNHRDHRKLLVVDGKIAFLGGINISAVYSSGISLHQEAAAAVTEPMRDTDVEIEGPVVAQCQELFLAEWVSEGGSPLAQRNYYPTAQVEGDEIVRVIGSVPERFSLIYVTLISAISNAEKNVWITDAYFAPEPQFMIALEDAARHGVDVRLLMPSTTNEPLILSAARSYYSNLMGAGVKIYELQGAMLHAKTATIDGVWSTVGSSNLDPWSILHNNEINAVILGPSFGRKMNLMFEHDLSNAKEITPETWRARGMIERMHEEIARVLQPVL